MNNPRFALLLANYRMHDQLTLTLAGIALLFVLVGWIGFARVQNRFSLFMKNVYYAMILFYWVLILIGMTAYVIGGKSL